VRRSAAELAALAATGVPAAAAQTPTDRTTDPGRRAPLSAVRPGASPTIEPVDGAIDGDHWDRDQLFCTNTVNG
jgi:hypothetical protein